MGIYKTEAEKEQKNLYTTVRTKLNEKCQMLINKCANLKNVIKDKLKVAVDKEKSLENIEIQVSEEQALGDTQIQKDVKNTEEQSLENIPMEVSEEQGTEISKIQSAENIEEQSLENIPMEVSEEQGTEI